MRWVLRAGMCAAVALEASVQGLEISNIVAVAPASSYMGGAVLNALKCTSQERRDLSVRALVANDADVVRCRQNCCGVIVGGGVASTLCDVSFPSLSTSAVGDHVLGDKTCFSTPPQRIKALAESLVGCDSLVVVKETHSTILELPRGVPPRAPAGPPSRHRSRRNDSKPNQKASEEILWSEQPVSGSFLGRIELCWTGARAEASPSPSLSRAPPTACSSAPASPRAVSICPTCD